VARPTTGFMIHDFGVESYACAKRAVRFRFWRAYRPAG
jgi:hypothetical protein